MTTEAMKTSLDNAGRIQLPQSVNWEELEYAPVPLRRAGQAAVRIQQRGKLLPMAYDLDNE